VQLTSPGFRGKLPSVLAFGASVEGAGTFLFPQSMARSEFLPEDGHSDATHDLEEHILAGFPPDLALDLVLNEVVVRAAEATHASSAALALFRGDEMVCRASTGPLAPGLGVPINTRDGLSGACLETRQPQLSVDTEFDPRVDPIVSRRLGIRSILIVPVFDNGISSEFIGVLEVFSPSPAAFSNHEQELLESFAAQCALLRRSALERSQRRTDRRPKAVVVGSEEPSPFDAPEIETGRPEVGGITLFDSVASHSAPSESGVMPPVVQRPPYETWALVLGGFTILATVALSFMIGSRIGWLSFSRRPTSESPTANQGPQADNCAGTANGCSAEQSSIAVHAVSSNSVPARKAGRASAKAVKGNSGARENDELVVYEKGKVVFRMKPSAAQVSGTTREAANKDVVDTTNNSVVQAASTKQIATPVNPRTNTSTDKVARGIWLSPSDAESRLLQRVEPQYPAEALAAHIAGDVVLKVRVSEEGSVSVVSTATGNPILARAAGDAVRKWRYKPYGSQSRLRPFETDVTLRFSLPK
jgi:TonB family protein